LEELINGKGKLAEVSEEGQGPSRTVEPTTTMMIVSSKYTLTKATHITAKAERKE
jgi:hypothetical protein